MLHLARDLFHSVVCDALYGCICDRHIAWTLVHSLPAGASLEWQFATSHAGPIPRHTVLRGTPFATSTVPAAAATGRTRLLLLKAGAPMPDLEGSACAPPIVPVVEFMDEATEAMTILTS